MRFKQIVETTTAGSVATVAQPMMTQTREDTNVRGLKPVQQVMKGAKKKGPYANSITESKVTEDDLAEQDLIVIPGQGRLRRTGFVKHDMDQGEHEGHTLKNSLHTIARAASDLDKRLSVQSEFPEWVSEKIGAAKNMMVTVMDYLVSSQEMQHDTDAMNEGSQRVDSLVTDSLRVMKGPEVSDAVLALKRVLGDRAYNERRGFYSFYIDQIHDMYNQQNINELSSGLLGRAAQAAKNKRNQAMEPKLHDALGGGYMNPLAKHYDNVSQKMDNRAGQVKRKETIQNIASKIASPAVMRKIGMNEGDVSTGNLQTMYNLARMAKNYCSDPEGKEALTELLRILKWYMDQGSEQGVTEDSPADQIRQSLSSRGFIDSSEQRNADRLERKRRHNEKLDKMHADFMGLGADNREGEHAAQQRMARDEYATQRQKDDDVAHRRTMDMFRDRMNRYQYSTQRDVDPEQLKKITDIKYESVDESMGSVDAKGRTAQEWVKLVKAKYPDAKIMQSKMPNGPWAAKLSGRTIYWEPAVQGVAEAVDIGQEWMSDTEVDQYVPQQLQQQWRDLLGYDRNGNPSALWANLTGGYEPDVNDPQDRARMVKVANKWFAVNKIPNVKFFNVRDADDELEWLVQIGSEQGVAEGEIDTSRMNKQHQNFYNTNPNFKRDDREVKSVGGRLATKVNPANKPAQVAKKPMTPFESIDNAWDAAKKKVAESYKKK